MSEIFKLVNNQKFSNGELLSFIHIGAKKEILEDSISLIEAKNKLQVLALADGMGGHAGGDFASQALHKELISQFKRLENDNYITHHILDAIEKANEKTKAHNNDAGATLAIVEIGKDYVRCFHAGDTKILILGSRGAIKYNSVSHSPRGYALASGALKTNSEKLPPANYVSNGLGFTPLSIEVTQKIQISNNDIIFISSDYIDDVIKEEQIINILCSDNFEKRAQNLLGKAMEEDKEYFSDDCSFQIFKISLPQ